MKVIAVLSRKGGTAKSTSARSFAVLASIAGMRSAILDLDPQETCVSWSKRRPHPAPSVESLGDRKIESVMADLQGRGAERVYLDTAPHNQMLMNLAAQTADACIITTGTGAEEIEQVGHVLEIVRRMGKPSAILLCKTQPRTSALVLARAALSAFGVPIIPTAITLGIVHVYAAAEGLTASEREPNGKGALELKQAWDWVEKELLSGKESGVVSDLSAARETRTRAKRA